MLSQLKLSHMVIPQVKNYHDFQEKNFPYQTDIRRYVICVYNQQCSSYKRTKVMTWGPKCEAHLCFGNCSKFDHARVLEAFHKLSGLIEGWLPQRLKLNLASRHYDLMTAKKAAYLSTCNKHPCFMRNKGPRLAVCSVHAHASTVESHTLLSAWLYLLSHWLAQLSMHGGLLVGTIDSCWHGYTQLSAQCYACTDQSRKAKACNPGAVAGLAHL